MFDREQSQRDRLRLELLDAAAEVADGTGARYRAFQRRYRDDPAAFARDAVEWPEGQCLTHYQTEILAAVPERRRLAVRGPHGLGKTALAALLVLWFALTRDGSDWKVITTASAWRQLAKYLWPEVSKWAGRIRWDVVGREPLSTRHELMTLSLKLGTGEAFAVASDSHELIEGAHADSLLYVLDEAKAIPPATWDAAEGALAGEGEAFVFAISTPGEPAGRFYEIHKRSPGLEDWTALHVTLEDALGAGRISREWAEQRRKQWGETSAVYQNRVLGEFAASDEDGVIPLGWVEAAVERWHVWDTAGRPGDFVALGVDVARSGRDSTVLAPRFGSFVGDLVRWSYSDTMRTTGLVVRELQKHNGGPAIVDVIGLGAGVLDRLREQGFRAIAFNASERSEATDRSGELRFLNTRAAAWWRLRELLDPANEPTVGLPPDDELIGDLTAPHWWINSSGKVQVESKDDIRKRLGRSTDAGDAVVQVMSDAASPQRYEYHTVERRRSTFGHGRFRTPRPRGRGWGTR